MCIYDIHSRISQPTRHGGCDHTVNNQGISRTTAFTSQNVKVFFFFKEDANKSYLNWNRSTPSISDYVYMLFEYSCEESSHKLVCN